MRIFLSVIIAALVPLTAAPALANDSTLHDPFEAYNRVIFKVNDALDQVLLEPLARGYRAVVPSPVRNGASNVLDNLKSPLIIGNQLLQGDLTGAGDATVRMVVNTLIGVGGIFDVAGAEGIVEEKEDFGQTLAVWGVGHGPYIVPPIFPPASLRDQVGYAVDSYVDPVRLWLHNTDRDGLMMTRTLFGFLDTRTQLLDALADLKRNSIDYYATVRSSYAQNRAAEVNDRGRSGTSEASIPNYAAGDE